MKELNPDGMKSRTFILAAGIWLISSGALLLGLIWEPATGAAERLGVDGNWWLYAVGLSATVFGATNTAQKRIISGLMKLRHVAAQEKGSDKDE